MKTVNIELTTGSTYTTLKRHYRRGEVYTVPVSEWEALRGEHNPVTGKPTFMISEREVTQTEGETTERPDVVKGGGITISHNTPAPMTREEAEKVGLGGFFREGKSVDTDTGAALAGTGGETAGEYTGPSGHEGLDEEETETIGDTPVSPVQAPVAAKKAVVVPTPKKVTVNRPGPRNADKKAALPIPKGSDIEQV